MAILSIQSHVAYGHAGNSAAVFPLERLGREVWAVNTVEFSNHTGYKAWRGRVLGAALAEEIVLGLEERGVLQICEAVLSGYLGDASVGRAIINAVKRVRSQNPGALYCCDPVMGDVGRGFYVNPDIPGIFRGEVIPLADIVTPNQFELEALTGEDTSSWEGVLRGIEKLHAAGPRVVLVTSYRGGNTTGALARTENNDAAGSSGAVPPAVMNAPAKELEMLVSGGSAIWRVTTPELQFADSSMMAGSGDLTTAIFLSRYLETQDIRRTLELTAGSVFGIMEATQKTGSRELLLVAAQDELVKPRHTFQAEKIWQRG